MITITTKLKSGTHALFVGDHRIGYAAKLIGSNRFGLHLDGIYWVNGEPTRRGGHPSIHCQRLKDAVAKAQSALVSLGMTAEAPTAKERPLTELLDPARFSGMSGKMAALVGYVLDTPMTEPAIAEVCLTSDGFVLARNENDAGANEFIGAASEVVGNFERLADAAGLNPTQRQELASKFKAKTTLTLS